jgi:hypothetical protein
MPVDRLTPPLLLSLRAARSPSRRASKTSTYMTILPRCRQRTTQPRHQLSRADGSPYPQSSPVLSPRTTPLASGTARMRKRARQESRWRTVRGSSKLQPMLCQTASLTRRMPATLLRRIDVIVEPELPLRVVDSTAIVVYMDLGSLLKTEALFVSLLSWGTTLVPGMACPSDVQNGVNSIPKHRSINGTVYPILKGFSSLYHLEHSADAPLEYAKVYLRTYKLNSRTRSRYELCRCNRPQGLRTGFPYIFKHQLVPLEECNA